MDKATYLPAFHQVLAELHELGVDAEAIFAWANCEDSLFKRNRKQLVAAMPALAVRLASEAIAPVMIELAAIVDRADSLVDNLSRITRVGKQSVRYLIGKPVMELGPTWLNTPLELLQAIDLLPREKLPQSAHEWSIMRSFWESIGLAGDYNFSRRAWLIQKRATLEEHLFVGLCRSGYQNSYEKLCERWQGDLGHLRDVGDYFGFVRQWCSDLHPETYDLGKNPIADNLLKRYSAMALIQQSEVWHRRLHEIQEPDSPNAKQEVLAQWLTLPELPWTRNSLSLVALTTPEVLKNEGLRLCHCVAGYTTACILGESHIVSIRDSDGQSLSTAEIALEANEASVIPIVRQHRGQENSLASAECDVVLNAWLKGWSEESVQSELRSIVQFHANQSRQAEVRSLLKLAPELSVESMNRLMQEVLSDYEAALAWLKKSAVFVRYDKANQTSVCTRKYPSQLLA